MFTEHKRCRRRRSTQVRKIQFCLSLWWEGFTLPMTRQPWNSRARRGDRARPSPTRWWLVDLVWYTADPKVLVKQAWLPATCRWTKQFYKWLWTMTGWWFGTFFIFPYKSYNGNNHPNWLSYFSEGLKPPIRWYSMIVQWISVETSMTEKYQSTMDDYDQQVWISRINYGGFLKWGVPQIIQVIRAWRLVLKQPAGDDWGSWFFLRNLQMVV